MQFQMYRLALKPSPTQSSLPKYIPYVPRAVPPSHTYPLLPQFFDAYVQHVCPLKQSTMVRDHLGISCIDDLTVPPLMDQAEITEIVLQAPRSSRGLVMDLLVRGELDKAVFVLRNADVLEIVHQLYQEAMKVDDPTSNLDM